MHLITHLRAKVALLFSGALLWCGTAMATELKETFSWDFATDASKLSSSLYLTSNTSYQIIDKNKFNWASVTTTNYGEKLAFSRLYSGSTNGNGILLQKGTGLASLKTGYTLTVIGLTPGEIVTVTCQASAINSSYEGSTGGTWDESASDDGTSYVYTMTSKGDLNLLYNAGGVIYTLKIETPIDENTVLTPTISEKGNSYASKEVTIECLTEGATIKYTVNGGDEQTANPFHVYETSTVVAWAEKNGNKSEEVTQTIVAGVIETPKIYTPINDGVNNTVELSCGTSAAKVQYKTSEADEYKDYTNPLTITETTTVYVKASYAETIDEVEHTYTADASAIVSPVTVNSIALTDFRKSAWNLTADTDATVGTDADSNNLVSLSIGETAISNVAVQSGTVWKMFTRYEGLMQYNSSGRNLGVLNVKKGQIVKVVGQTGTADFSLSLSSTDIAEANLVATKEGSAYVYNIISDGTLVLSMARNGCLLYVEVFEEPSSIDVTVGEAGYATLFYNQPTTIPTGVEAYVGALSEDKSVLNLTAVTGTIPANTAVILKAAAGTYTFEPADAADAITGNDLQGTTKELATTSVEGQAYILSSKSGANVGFYKFSGETLAANKAYLVLPAASAAPVVRFNFGEGTEGNVTGIESIEAEQAGAARIFDLQGRSLRQVPQKGMYILNGRKVIR